MAALIQAAIASFFIGIADIIFKILKDGDNKSISKNIITLRAN
jgi:hypothetical protein